MRSLSKKSKKVIEKGLGELKQRSSLAELTRIGARMMLGVAVEEEFTAFLGRDYYERRTNQEGSRSGSKPRTIKIGSGDIEINMPKAREAGGAFHSKILPPHRTRMDEVQDVIPLLLTFNNLSLKNESLEPKNPLFTPFLILNPQKM